MSVCLQIWIWLGYSRALFANIQHIKIQLWCTTEYVKYILSLCAMLPPFIFNRHSLKVNSGGTTMYKNSDDLHTILAQMAFLSLIYLLPTIPPSFFSFLFFFFFLGGGTAMTNTAMSNLGISYPFTFYKSCLSLQNKIIGIGFSLPGSSQVKWTFYPGDQMHLICGFSIPGTYQDGNRVVCSYSPPTPKWSQHCY